MRHALRWLLGTIAVMAILCVAAFLLIVRALADSSDVSEDEVARARSPDGRLEAVLVERNAGATTSFGYVVHVVPVGDTPGTHEVAFVYGAVRNTSAYGVNLRWLSSHQLRIEYWNAKSSELKQPKVVAGGHTVIVSLAPGVLDSSAQPGGMLYNLRGRQ